jgi:hypothetical protein
MNGWCHVDSLCEKEAVLHLAVAFRRQGVTH